MPANVLVSNNVLIPADLRMDTDEYEDNVHNYGEQTRFAWPDLPCSTTPHRPSPIRFPSPERGFDPDSQMISIPGHPVAQFLLAILRSLRLLPAAVVRQDDEFFDESGAPKKASPPPPDRTEEEEEAQYEDEEDDVGEESVVMPTPLPVFGSLGQRFTRVRISTSTEREELDQIQGYTIRLYRIRDLDMEWFYRNLMEAKLHARYIRQPEGYIFDLCNASSHERNLRYEAMVGGEGSESWLVVGRNEEFIRKTIKMCGGQVPPYEQKLSAYALREARTKWLLSVQAKFWIFFFAVFFLCVGWMLVSTIWMVTSHFTRARVAPLLGFKNGTFRPLIIDLKGNKPLILFQ